MMLIHVLEDGRLDRETANLQKHVASPRFWRYYRVLPNTVRKLADKNFELLKADPHHPSLHLKKIDRLWSVRVGAHYRALGLDGDEAIIWFWIGSHSDYDKLI